MADWTVSRTYTGPVKAVILDWAGTTIDKYVVAPIVVFVELFKKYKVPITMQQAREPMGLRKDLHIKAVMDMNDVRTRWKQVHGKYPDQTDVDSMYKEAKVMQVEVCKGFKELLPGVAKATQQLQKDGIKIGTTTGYLESMVEVVLPAVREQGYKPDAVVAGDSVKNGSRPNPHMLYKNMDLLDISAIQAVVKVDDTITGIHEAHAAGCWGVGVARYSNYMDLDGPEQEAELGEDEIQRRLAKSRDKLREGGCHYVIDSLLELPGVIKDINARLARGEKP